MRVCPVRISCTSVARATESVASDSGSAFLGFGALSCVSVVAVDHESAGPVHVLGSVRCPCFAPTCWSVGLTGRQRMSANSTEAGQPVEERGPGGLAVRVRGVWRRCSGYLNGEPRWGLFCSAGSGDRLRICGRRLHLWWGRGKVSAGERRVGREQGGQGHPPLTWEGRRPPPCCSGEVGAAQFKVPLGSPGERKPTGPLCIVFAPSGVAWRWSVSSLPSSIVCSGCFCCFLASTVALSFYSLNPCYVWLYVV